MAMAGRPSARMEMSFMVVERDEVED